MKRLPEITKVLKNKDTKTKIKIFMSTKTTGDAYNPYESNYTFSNLNPITAIGYSREISPSSLIYRQMGQKESGALQITIDSKYRSYFELCNKIEINSDTYEVYRETVGSRASIQTRPFKMISVILSKK